MDVELYRLALGLAVVLFYSLCLTVMPFVRNAEAISIRLPQLVFPLLGGVTFLAIVSVKSSLALSLGMVGALSIVRFRTPIKDPLELTLLFFTIGVAVGCAADFLKQTIVIATILLVSANVIYFTTSNKSYITYGRTIVSVETFNRIDFSTISAALQESGRVKLLNRSITDGSERLVIELYIKSSSQVSTDIIVKRLHSIDETLNIELVNEQLFA